MSIIHFKAIHFGGDFQEEFHSASSFVWKGPFNDTNDLIRGEIIFATAKGIAKHLKGQSC